MEGQINQETKMEGQLEINEKTEIVEKEKTNPKKNKTKKKH